MLVDDAMRDTYTDFDECYESCNSHDQVWGKGFEANTQQIQTKALRMSRDIDLGTYSDWATRVAS